MDYRADAADPATIEQTLSDVACELGQIDVLFHNMRNTFTAIGIPINHVHRFAT